MKLVGRDCILEPIQCFSKYLPPTHPIRIAATVFIE
jgi:hypothetical protein